MVSNERKDLDELFDLGDIDSFLNEAKEKCTKKLQGKTFAGMECDDVIQEILIKVHKALENYEQNKSRVSTYVDHVIENQIRDCFRKCGSEKNLLIVNAVEIEDYAQMTAPTESHLFIGREEIGYAKVEMSVDFHYHLDLTEREKEIFDLRMQGFEFAEIADMLGVNKSRISQIWKTVKYKYDYR